MKCDHISHFNPSNYAKKFRYILEFSLFKDFFCVSKLLLLVDSVVRKS